MDKGVIFWVLMILWFFFGAYRHDWKSDGSWAGFGGNLLLFVLLFLLGWGVFGFVVH